jgi:hypothetical protein
MDRREFLAKAGLVATWAGVSVVVGACSDDGDGGTSPDDGGEGVTGSVTGGGHGHSGAVITQAELDAGQSVLLTLTGSGHVHTVVLTGLQVLDVADGTTVVLQTEPDSTGHTHTVTFN